MSNVVLIISAFVSVIFFPWLLTAGLAIVLAFIEPVAVIALGLFADTLYYSVHAGGLPLFTFGGLILGGIGLLVRNQLRASTM
ncbi:MAG: hypothetical protein JWN18_376 [Parcubacteria group bacterium]|nr:hypothetical protein [Parcubacteria group bacterium]